MIRIVLAAFAATLSLASPLAAQQEIRAGSLVIERPWTRATPEGARVAGGFMTIRNLGTEPDRLIGGAFPNAPRVEVHEMRMDGGTMRMREVAGGLVIPPGGSVELKPGSYHMMFMDLGQQVRPGQPQRGALVFERAGTVTVDYQVAPVGARSPDGAPAPHPAGMPRH